MPGPDDEDHEPAAPARGERNIADPPADVLQLRTAGESSESTPEWLICALLATLGIG